MARLGKGIVDRLLEAYKHNFEVWRDGTLIHIHYGRVNMQCYCHGGPAPVKIVETVRRGGATCNFVAELA